jgi:hypothetical protein
MIVLVFDPLAVLLLIAANWQLKKERGILTPLEESFKPDAWVADVTLPDDVKIPEPVAKVIEPEDDLLFEEQVEVKYEPSKGWEPELYNRVGVKTHEKELGRYESELLEQEKKRKVQSFLTKVGTIEEDVEQLNKK